MSAHADAPAVLALGDPRLRLVAAPVEDVTAPDVLADVRALTTALERFREAGGFGRAISAPQIGVSKRIVVLDLGEGPVPIFNPVITWRSDERFTMWDDCMSFPSLLVRVERHESISLQYVDEEGQGCEWLELGRAESELLQHEIDHLDGILAIDLATGEGSIVTRSVFEAAPERYAGEVDYVIAPRGPSNRPPPPAGG